MKSPRKFLSIRTKLILIIILTMGAITAVGFLVDINRNLNHLRSELVREASSYSQLLSQDFVKIIAFGTVDNAADVTARLRSREMIQAVTLYDKQHQALYYYRGKSVNHIVPPGQQAHHQYEFVDGLLLLYEPVTYQGVHYGDIYMQLSTHRMDEALQSYIIQGAIIALALLITALLLLYLIQYYFSKPILLLANALEYIARTQDYSRRLPVGGDDEIGTLFRGFNSMQKRVQQARTKLELSNVRQEMVLSVANDGTWHWNIDTATLALDDRCYTMAGYQPNEFPQIFSEWEKRIHPDYIKFVTQSINQYLAGELEDFDIEFQFLCKHGTYMWLRCRGKITARDLQNRPSRFVGTHSDISEQKQIENALRDSERKYRTLFEKSADAILIIEGNRFVDCNSAAVDLLGYKNKKELLDAHPSQLSPELQADGSDSFEKANKMISTALHDGSHRFEWDHKRANGDIIPVEVLLTSVSVGERSFLHVVWRDMSERRQIEEALRRTQKLDAIGQLTGGIAHDFNNILGIILGNLSLLECHIDTDEKNLRRIETIKHTAQRAVKLTKQLLSFSRIEAGSVEVTNINRIIENMHGLLTQSLTPQVEVKNSLTDDLWQTEIDPGDFEDVLLNLALNSRDAMAGKGKLIIETRNAILDEKFCSLNPEAVVGEYVELAVSDSGEGIARENQEKIFDPFFTTKEQGKGTGLGLAMVFGFVKRSAGTIKVYSEPGIGTTFRLYLPRACSDKIQTEPDNTPVESLPAGKELILIVDDEPALLELVEETLQSFGYQTLLASNGKQALEILAKTPAVDMVFTDVVMPGMNGYELAEKVIAMHPGLKILLTSGYTELATARNGQAQFNANILSKPYSQRDLAQRVRETLG